MSQTKVTCKSCNNELTGEVYHLGFSDLQALYCSTCPRVLLLHDHDFIAGNGITFPSDSEFQFFNRHYLPYYRKVENLFLPCDCGGQFGFLNPPRCPHCNGLLRGNCYEDKPILKQRDGYVFVSAESVYDRDQIKPEFANPASRLS